MWSLFSPFEHEFERFPSTRYQGSKRRMARWIVEQCAELEYRTVLDAFGGTGSVAYAFKCAGKQVTYNDALAFNHRVGKALIENHGVQLRAANIDALFSHHPGAEYGDFISRTFRGVYFTEDENALLDRIAGNLAMIDDPCAEALAVFSVGQAAMAKRPYNLFHRANLYLRLAEVERGFGNKASWDRPFEAHIRTFADEANRAVFDNGEPCRAVQGDALGIEGSFDLVYIDPPYVSASGVGLDYRDSYHFLEGFVAYTRWPAMVDKGSKHRRLRPEASVWTHPSTIHSAFTRLFQRFRDSVIVVSYRSDGIPGVGEIEELLHGVKRHVRIARRDPQPYALSTRRATQEVLLVGTD